MIQQDPSNILFDLASGLVIDTSQHLFLTGKAGTGKTTFLKFIQERTNKNTVVVAPTGVAAINAGGVTMHSFFQLPRGIFIPGIAPRDGYSGFSEITDRHSLFKNIHFNTNKRLLMEELELLIIDEVSMMRCDMLDAIDLILRHFRKTPNLPFGGVQVLYIGDMFQLPPVVSQEEWNLLKRYYKSPFFFSANVFVTIPPIYIELQKIYRQTEQTFIDMLNRIRNNEASSADFDFLNTRYNPHFAGDALNRFITITTHNAKAEAINREELSRLKGQLYTFNAIVKHDFSDKAYPTDVELHLKVGAQVMFVKNDNKNERRYFNGKIASIKKISSDEITVAFVDGTEMILETEVWKHLRYSYNKEQDHIDEEELGSFTQYPIRLAWAITVHKSQGLTFEKAIIDAGASFAPGQVYVALSRCTSLNGIVLKSRILPHAVSTDPRIVEFSQKEIRNADQLQSVLEKEKYKYWGTQLLKLFDFQKLETSLRNWREIIPEKKLPDVPLASNLAKSILSAVHNLANVAQKFKIQLEQLLLHTYETGETTELEKRMQKAIGFFKSEIKTKVIDQVQEHMISIQYNSRLKQYNEVLHEIDGVAHTLIHKLLSSSYGTLHFADASSIESYKSIRKDVKKKGVKEPKGASRKFTEELFKAGKTIDEIAKTRTMAISTIEGHLASLVRTGDIEASEIVSQDKLNCILKIISELGLESAGLIKTRLGDAYSYHEIRVGMNHYVINKQPV